MSLLEVEEFKARLAVAVAIEDPALQALLDEAEQAIDDVAGPLGAVVESHVGGGTIIILGRLAGSITTVKEIVDDATTTLATDDWLLSGDGRSLVRQLSGTHASSSWVGRVEVTFAARDDTLLRKRVQTALVKLEMASNPGIAGETIGSYSVQYQQGKPYAQLREEILAGLFTWGFA